MIRRSFKMKLCPGCAQEYRRRHNAIWPEVVEMIHAHGGGNYSIFLDEETNLLLGYIELQDPELWARSRELPLLHKWWDYMADLMETNEDNSPVSIPLIEMFHLD